jgi:aminoglycoside phosphotransferase (APT) family kinase protein
VRRWIDGRPATDDRIADPVGFARDLAGFLVALWGVDPAGGPAAGAHSFHRGGALAVYDEETRAAVATLGTRVDRAAATRMWEDALAAGWNGAPVWFHGDVAEGNLLVDEAGRLSAVIDFGTSGVGDPACDLVIAWTLFDGASRAAFVEEVGQDAGTWARARGWALWKALITWAAPDAAPRHVDGARRTLARLRDPAIV